jgi:RNA polymerase subunit RPABC4/transcription elongation factor Spt4
MVIRDTDWNAPIGDDELPDEDDLIDGENPAVVPCPSCGELIPDDADQCASCGDWVIAASSATERAAGWFWPVVVAGLVLVILVFWHGLGR